VGVDRRRSTAQPLSVDDLQYYESRFFLVPGTGTVDVDAKLSVIRHRWVSLGFREEVTIINHDEHPVDLTVRLEAGGDFADLFEVKDAIAKKGFPRATCELQGYAYDAKTRGARLAREFWGDPEFAERLERDAADLKRRFNEDFWVADGEYFALALDAEGGQVDALSSNISHLLWSGIVDDAKADAVVRHLLGPRLYSGWGVRTLAEGEGRYNPIGYRVGTVWPFDCSFIAWGLRRYGYRDEAATIAAGILDAATVFEGRLPEAFAGYERQRTKYPVQYPTACSPQAWSTGTPLLLLRTMLGMEPQGSHLVVEPALPSTIPYLALLDIPGRWGLLDADGRARELNGSAN
jgi:glycogen debranching enzyme